MSSLDTLIAFLSAHRAVLISFHLLGVVLGLGGATFADLFFFRFLRDFKISKHEAETLSHLSFLILIALLILYVTGVGIFLTDVSRYSHSPAFLMKAIVVGVLSINGFVMHRHISPKLIHLSFTNHQLQHEKKMTFRRLAFAMGAISFTSWYSAFFIATLKSYLTPAVTLSHLLFAYLLILAIAIPVSQYVQEHYFAQFASQKT